VTESNNSQTTNEFFQEQSIPITVNTGEKELVDFLLDIGSGSSMIRVRDMNLRPADQNRYRLQGTITLSANYQKKPVPKAAAPATTKPSTTTAKPAAKPAVAAPQSKPATKPATVPTRPATTPTKTIPSPVRKP
jgi:hypothetical protein